MVYNHTVISFNKECLKLLGFNVVTKFIESGVLVRD